MLKNKSDSNNEPVISRPQRNMLKVTIIFTYIYVVILIQYFITETERNICSVW